MRPSTTTWPDASSAQIRPLRSRTFSGDLTGESRAEILITKSEGGGGYTGQDLITGTLNGKAGSFVIQHGGILGPDGVTNSGTIVPGTGAGELEGITGQATLLAEAADELVREAME